MDAGSVLGNDVIFEGFSLAQVGDGEVVLRDGGVVALKPAVVVPLISTIDFPLHHVPDYVAAAVIDGHGPTQ